jgi:hypothetical protein
MLLDNSTQGMDELNNLPYFDSVVYIFWSANFPSSSSSGLGELIFIFLVLAVWLLVWHLF